MRISGVLLLLGCNTASSTVESIKECEVFQKVIKEELKYPDPPITDSFYVM